MISNENVALVHEVAEEARDRLLKLAVDADKLHGKRSQNVAPNGPEAMHKGGKELRVQRQGRFCGEKVEHGKKLSVRCDEVGIMPLLNILLVMERNKDIRCQCRDLFM